MTTPGVLASLVRFSRVGLPTLPFLFPSTVGKSHGLVDQCGLLEEKHGYGTPSPNSPERKHYPILHDDVFSAVQESGIREDGLPPPHQPGGGC